MNTIERIYNSTLNNGGYTNPKLQGYSVALPFYESKIAVSEFTVEKLRQYHDKMNALGFEVGTWLNSEDNHVYLDAITIVGNKEVAMELGKKYKQIAIYDINENKEIFI